VRELENVIERAVLICSDTSIGTEHLFLENVSEDSRKSTEDEKVGTIQTGSEQNEKASTLYDMEKNMIFDTLNKENWNKTKASKILGISVRTMRNKLHEYGINDLSNEDK
jgi:DNA-binding NtrC family response regulator